MHRDAIQMAYKNVASSRAEKPPWWQSYPNQGDDDSAADSRIPKASPFATTSNIDDAARSRYEAYRDIGRPTPSGLFRAHEDVSVAKSAGSRPREL